MSHKGEVTVKVTSSGQGKRLDLFLCSLPHFESRSVVTRVIKEGRVFLNGEPVRKGGVLVREGDLVTFSFLDENRLTLRPQPLPLEVLFEDDHLLVVNKPAGMVVHPSKGHHDGTLANALVARCKGLPTGGGAERPGIVHRLDKGTSGVLVVAKSDSAHRLMVEAFSKREVDKVYLAFVHGVPFVLSQTVSAPIGRNPRHRTMMGVVKGGREATSEFLVLSKGKGFSLLKVRIRTGRTHQIRVHASHIGHPVVGDELYGRKGDHERYGITRPALHSWRLSFTHPVYGKSVSVYAPLPPDLLVLADTLGLEIPKEVEEP